MQEESNTLNQDKKKAQLELNQNHTCATFISKFGYTF